MIFERSLQRELAYTAGAVFMVLLTIMLTTMMIRIVGFAAQGQIDPKDVVVLIGLTVIGYLAVMLIVTLFVSILFVLTRWYRDSEMVVWLASGVSQTQLIKPIAVFSTPIIILIIFFAFVGWPWSNQQSKLIKTRFQQRDEVSLLAPGQFRESPTTQRVFFIEKMSPDQSHVQNVFVTSTEGDKVNVIVSQTGHTETRDGDRFIVLENGRRYDGLPGQPNFRITEFERYGVKIMSHEVINTPTTTGISTPALLANPTRDNLAEFAWRAGLPLIAINLMLLAIPTRDNLAEFAWRAGLPLIAINLMLLAIPLSYQNPRRSRTINLVMAVLIYLTYSNLLNVVQSWIEQGKLSFGVGIVGLHVVVSLLVAFIFYLRVRNRPLFTLSSFSRKGA
jgi:lipopolysaccharide export system permease protein